MTVARLHDELSAEEHLLWHEHFQLEAKRAKDEEKRRGG